jgi:ribosomal protein S27E
MADFGELTDYDSHFEIWPCQYCRKLVLAQRRPYRFDLRPCPLCRMDIPFVYPRLRSEVRCPVCGSTRIKYTETAHLLIGHDFTCPRVGDIVHATFEGGAFGAVKVPDMPAIPIHHVTDLPAEIGCQIGELRVTSIPSDWRNDREFTFTFLGTATIKNANNPMDRSGGSAAS